MQQNIQRRNFLGTAGAKTLGLFAGAGMARAFAATDDGASPLPESSATTGLVRDDRYLLHRQGGRHPESPERLRAIHRRLEGTGLGQKLVPIAATVDPSAYMGMVHSAAHIRTAARQANDDAICRLAVSGTLTAVDAVCAGKVRNAFCAIRPPGHHAANNGDFGFCF